MDFGAALIGLLSAFVVKIAVLLFAARLLFKLYGATATKPPKRIWLLLPKENLPEIQILKWSLVCFFASELTCGVEVFILFQSNPILTGFHSIVSALGMGLFALGIYLLIDKKFLRYGAQTCIVNRLCKGCTIQEPIGCKFQQVILYMSTFLALTSIYSWFASVETTYSDPTKFLLPFSAINAWYDQIVIPWLTHHIPNYLPGSGAFHFPKSAFTIEFRILPALTLVLTLASIWLVLHRRETLALKILMFGGGMLCYTYFELILYRATGDILLGSLAHEIAEFWFLIATAEFLRRSFPVNAVANPTTSKINI